MSHHHAPPPTPPTVTAFLTPMVGRDVALIRDGHPKLTGLLEAVQSTPYVDDPLLVVAGHAVDFTACARVKLHFTDVDRKRHR